MYRARNIENDHIKEFQDIHKHTANLYNNKITFLTFCKVNGVQLKWPVKIHKA
jgi:hypothetical protein